MDDSTIEMFTEIWSLIESHVNTKLKADMAESFVKILDEYGYDMSEPGDFMGHNKYIDRALKSYVTKEDDEYGDYDE